MNWWVYLVAGILGVLVSIHDGMKPGRKRTLLMWTMLWLTAIFAQVMRNGG